MSAMDGLSAIKGIEWIIDAGTLVFACLMFGRLYEKRRTAQGFGVLLYMLCPFRIYSSHTKADYAMALVWMLIPLYLWSMTALMRTRQKGIQKFLYLLPAVLALTGIGYADILQLLIVCGITLCAFIYTRIRRPLILLPPVLGCILCMPRLLLLKSYLSGDRFDELKLSLESIAPKGYSVGGLFSSYVSRNDSPGLGLALFLCLLTGLWLLFVKNRFIKETGAFEEESAFFPFWGIMGGLLTLPALSFFPWDYIRRVGAWMVRLVAMLETPAVFFGYAQICFCILGAGILEAFHRQENRIADISVQFLVCLSAIGSGIYWCFLQ